MTSNQSPPVGPSAQPGAVPSVEDVKQKQRCETLVAKALKNPFVKFMLEAMKKEGCDLNAEQYITCEPCNAQIGGGFKTGVGVVMCQNHLLDQEQTNLILTHELIHAYDECRAHVDWSNCLHHACSEIRAANLSGDCHWWQEFRRGHMSNIKAQHQICVRRRALLSLAMNPSCTEAEAKDAVDRAWSVCFADTQPFDRIP